MPEINLLKKMPKKETTEVPLTEQKLLRRKFYNSVKWQKLRVLYLREHPLCEKCLNEGKVNPAEQVHHKRSPFNYKEKIINWELGLDPDNLESICSYHHGIEHTAGDNYESPEKTIQKLEELLGSVK